MFIWNLSQKQSPTLTCLSKKHKMEEKDGDSIPRQIARTSSTESVSAVYLVVGHGVTCPAYSVFKVNPPAVVGGGGDDDGDTPVPLPQHLARLPSKHCMSFVPVRSRRHAPWIVGVGGNTGIRDYGPETIVFDTNACKVVSGPKLLSTKLCPILVPMGERIYALAGMPCVTGDINFVPWFEVLDLSMARVIDNASGCCLLDCEWKPLPRPPFFPWDLTPTVYIFPPVVTVKSHVAVGSYILLSITGHGQKGTHMFDTETQQWAKLDDKDLPFIGRAIPLQGTLLFLGSSNTSDEITAYKIDVSVSSSVASPSTITAGHMYFLSIVEIQMLTYLEDEEEIVTGCKLISFDYPAGNPGFCSLNWVNNDPHISFDFPQHVGELVTIRAYSNVDYLESTRALVISNQWKQVYSIYDPLRRLSSPCLAGVISL